MRCGAVSISAGQSEAFLFGYLEYRPRLGIRGDVKIPAGELVTINTRPYINTFTWSGARGVAGGYTEALAVGEAVMSTGPLESLTPCNLHNYLCLGLLPFLGPVRST
jgi:hypothetical protein